MKINGPGPSISLWSVGVYCTVYTERRNAVGGNRSGIFQQAKVSSLIEERHRALSFRIRPWSTAWVATTLPGLSPPTEPKPIWFAPSPPETPICAFDALSRFHDFLFFPLPSRTLSSLSLYPNELVF